jgi:PAS domain S-box-containing protein
MHTSVAQYVGRICRALHRQTGRNFERCPEETLLHRVERRMRFLQMVSGEEYAARVESDAAEADALVADVQASPWVEFVCANSNRQSSHLDSADALRRLNRTLRAWSHSNQALLHATDEAAYRDQVCRIIAEDCGHATVWVGIAEADEAKTIRPVAAAGVPHEYLETLRISWADAPRGWGPTGTAARTGVPCICRDTRIDPNFSLWRHEPALRGCAAAMSLPLVSEGTVFGVLTIYARQPDPFTDDEVQLLCGLAGDFAHGIMTLRLRAEHARTQESLAASEQRYRGLVEHSPDAILIHRQNRIEYVNPAALRLFGAAAADELLGRAVFDLFHPGCHAQMAERIDLLNQGQIVPLVERKVVRLDQRVIDVEVAATAFTDRQGAGIQAILRDISDRKRTEEALRESEQRVRTKLDSILLPQGDIGNLELTDIIDTQAIQTLFEEFYRLVPIPMAIVDLHGKVLVGVGWQDICTQFHRRHAMASLHCQESDTQLSSGVAEGQFKVYQCKNRMWDVATPIIVGGQHMGNLFVGQFFFTDETVDRELFRVQAQQFGFDEAQYLAALERVPRLSRELLDANMKFFMKLAEMVSKLSYSNIRLARSLSERENLMQSLRQSEEQLRVAKEAAEGANEAKSRFLANISHELRTPMNAILGMTDLALGEELSAGARDCIQTVKDSADMLLLLLNEILDFSRIEAGKFSLAPHPFVLRATIEETLKSLAVKAREKGLEFACRVAADVPDCLMGDSVRLRQVLVNLLSNAIKFTDHGRVSLEVGTNWQSAADVELQFVVEDTGVGIAREDQEQIFAPFAQGAVPAAGSRGGTGLGLSIAASIVQMMEGRISVDSEPNRGSAFSFTAKFGRTTLAAIPSRPAAAAVPDAAPRKLRVLLAEDTAANQKLVLRMLTKRGHEVQIAENGAQAIDLLQTLTFDVILMDVQMPIMDGFEATAAIRRGEPPGARRLPIIAMTAYAMKGDQERCLAAGMDAYLSKPVSSRELIELVERLADENPAQQLSSLADEVEG